MYQSPMTGRFLIMLVVLTAMVATQQPATSEPAPQPTDQRQDRAAWTARLEVGLSKSITRSALLQRIAFADPRPPLAPRFELDTHAVQQRLPDPFRYCLPPPAV